MTQSLPMPRPASEHVFTKAPRASHTSSSIRTMRIEGLSHTLAAEIDRAASAAHSDAEEVTVELAVSANGRLAPTPRRVGDTTPYVDIEMTLRPVDPLKLKSEKPGQSTQSSSSGSVGG